ncbi:hypothetical protein PAHAL_5G374100 [Panicum hallii]|uniref:Uncharacterized protein n=1 Tax=Panicum hallii TaxID=206008 RepID=A0A2T8IMG9_9POAL|nr:hypothetical protein PAHAL_5G374100 [Panicum hallii]
MEEDRTLSPSIDVDGTDLHPGRHCNKGEIDRKKQNERERMDQRVKLEQADMDRKVHMAQVEMDFMIKEARVKIDQMLQEQRQHLDRMLMQERDNLDHRLKEEREEMDHIIEMEKWEEEIHGKDINNVLLEEKQGNNAGLASTERLKAFINGSERLTSDTELRMKRARDSSSCSDVSWQPKKHHPDSSNDD